MNRDSGEEQMKQRRTDTTRPWVIGTFQIVAVKLDPPGTLPRQYRITHPNGTQCVAGTVAYNDRASAIAEAVGRGWRVQGAKWN
jgi:hypothetical protein